MVTRLRAVAYHYREHAELGDWMQELAVFQSFELLVLRYVWSLPHPAAVVASCFVVELRTVLRVRAKRVPTVVVLDQLTLHEVLAAKVGPSSALYDLP